jgi:hypothetical protein
MLHIERGRTVLIIVAVTVVVVVVSDWPVTVAAGRLERSSVKAEHDVVWNLLTWWSRLTLPLRCWS